MQCGKRPARCTYRAFCDAVYVCLESHACAPSTRQRAIRASNSSFSRALLSSSAWTLSDCAASSSRCASCRRMISSNDLDGLGLDEANTFSCTQAGSLSGCAFDVATKCDSKQRCGWSSLFKWSFERAQRLFGCSLERPQLGCLNLRQCLEAGGGGKSLQAQG